MAPQKMPAESRPACFGSLEERGPLAGSWTCHDFFESRHEPHLAERLGADSTWRRSHGWPI